MEWIPIFLVAFKLIVFGTGMFFAIKWHYDREKEEKEKAQRSAESTSSQAPAERPLPASQAVPSLGQVSGRG